jgi:hypothetical protein
VIQGFKKVGMAIVATAVAGALLGVLLGALSDNYLLWIGVMLVVGASFGIAIGYGFLPES